MSELKTRTVTGLVALALLIGLLYIGSWPLVLALLVVGLIMVWEMATALEAGGRALPLGLVLLASFGHFLASYFGILDRLFGLAIYFFILAAYFIHKEEGQMEDLGLGLMVFAYIPLNFFCLLDLLHTEYLYLIFILSFATDTSAYLAGNLFGRHKLIPRVSPKKTLEGALGGLVGGVAISMAFLGALGHPPSFLQVAFLAGASIAGQIGDLFASKIKRQTGIKDFGNILPGHGGLLDRFDSILFIIPLVYAYFKMVA